MGLKQDFDAMPLPVKAGVYIAGGYLLYKGGKYAWKKLNPPIGAVSVQQAKTEAEEIMKNNKVLPPGERMNASYSPSQMSTFADSLYSAMEGFGTDEKIIEDVFGKMKNDLDILLLIDAYGVRDDENLSQWLQDDGMTKTVNKILSTKAKISKRF